MPRMSTEEPSRAVGMLTAGASLREVCEFSVARGGNEIFYDILNIVMTKKHFVCCTTDPKTIVHHSEPVEKIQRHW